MSELADLDLEAFIAGLRAVCPQAHGLSEPALRRLHVHYRELRLWNRRLSLIGPGTEDQVLERHYGESLAAASVLFPGAGSAVPVDADHSGAPAEPGQRLLDVGSGAGFPGWVLAAAYPGLEVTLVESRQRKWAFLQSAARKAALPIHCLDARVRLPLAADLPPAIDWVTLRAIRMPVDVLGALARRLRPGGSFLFWQGRDDPELPPELELGPEWPLPGSRQRRVLQAVKRSGQNRTTGCDRPAMNDRQ